MSCRSPKDFGFHLMWPPMKHPNFAILAAAVVQFPLGGFLKIF